MKLNFQANKKVLVGILFQLPTNTTREEVKFAPWQLCADTSAHCVRIPEDAWHSGWLGLALSLHAELLSGKNCSTAVQVLVAED